MTLFQEIQAKCSVELIASNDHQAIAQAVNLGRTRFRRTHLGEGGIIAAIGSLDVGNTFLDVVSTAPAYRHIKKVIARGDFDMGEAMAQGGVQAMVAVGVLTQAQADSLCALGLEANTVTVTEVAQALELGV